MPAPQPTYLSACDYFLFPVEKGRRNFPVLSWCSFLCDFWLSENADMIDAFPESQKLLLSNAEIPK